jgi:hypothetical protein
MSELEFEFRVYRTREQGGRRECIVARSVPHALQVWQESTGSYSRNLELVISGNWLMQLLAYDGGACDEVNEDQRARIAQLCIEGLVARDSGGKQESLEKVLMALGYDLDAIRRELGLGD